MSLSDRLQATFRQYEAMDHSAPILRSSIEQSYKNAGEIEQTIRVLKSGLTMAWLPIFVIAYFLGRFAVVSLRVGQSIADGIIGVISRWWAG